MVSRSMDLMTRKGCGLAARRDLELGASKGGGL